MADESTKYFQTDKATIEFSTPIINDYYNRGFVLTRIGKGEMIQTRSLRIDLAKFELNSENRRILKKNEDLGFLNQTLPLEDYSWEIHSLGKKFYTEKFGDGTMSAAKIKEMFQDPEKSNMNAVFKFKYITDQATNPSGYCLCYQNEEIIHYAYPFYDLEIPKEQNLGIAMMTKAIEWAKSTGRKYIYLGSVVESSSKYKLQFSGIEWFDVEKKEWSTDIDILKTLITPE